MENAYVRNPLVCRSPAVTMRSSSERITPYRPPCRNSTSYPALAAVECHGPNLGNR